MSSERAPSFFRHGCVHARPCCTPCVHARLCCTPCVQHPVRAASHVKRRWVRARRQKTSVSALSLETLLAAHR
eukprot:363737-Chlamydomonas_euryale.AAC.6